MYTTEQGYKVIIFNTARNKQYSFTMLGSKSYVENELKALGFSANDIAFSTYAPLTPEQLNQHIEEIEGAWDSY